MNSDAALLLPLSLVLAGAGIAAVFGLPALNSRLSITRLCWLVALFPTVAFGLLLFRVPLLAAGEVFTWQIAWVPALDLSAGIYLDSLAALFACLVTSIGAIVIVYTGQYFKGDQSAWRFLTYMMLFMASMLGLVMAGDVITMFVFWEGTSITSYLLVAYKTDDEAARQGAFRAFVITVGGGIALLVGLLLVSATAGSTQWSAILHSGEALRDSPVYLLMLGLVAVGAFTKSAQFPAHIWLPGAMSAPTPASAFLHSATMVKAGIYLMARMNPVLGLTESWFWLLTIVGLLTMLTGAYLGLKQNDLKALLAYSTISQLGALMLLIGQDIAKAFGALVVGIVAHALYKSALFLVAGIVDHETGTRDMARLGGLRKAMLATFIVATTAAMSMAGLPPMLGFVAKEGLMATTLSNSLPPLMAVVLPAAAILAGALLLAQAALLINETFLGQPKDPSVRAHEAPRPMWLMPAIPALLSLLLAFVPQGGLVGSFLTAAASDAFAGQALAALGLWHGFNLPLIMSLAAIALGLTIFAFRRPVRAWQQRALPELGLEPLYRWTLESLDRLGRLATRLQSGNLQLYMVIILAGMVALIAGLTTQSLVPDLSLVDGPLFRGLTSVGLLRLFALVVTICAALFTITLRSDFTAILSLSAAGLGMAILFVLEPAPDVALVQIVVDMLATVILVLALSRIPRRQRLQAQLLVEREYRGRDRRAFIRDVTIAVLSGAIVMGITFVALVSRPRGSDITPYYEANAKAATGATDIVGAIVVDFRGFDSLMEITVFSMAGLGIYMLLRYGAHSFGDSGPALDEEPKTPPHSFATLGIGGRPTSPFIRVVTSAVLPIAMVIAIVEVMYGHDQPGDGFTAGVIIGLAVGLCYVVFGYEETRRRLPWLNGSRLIVFGIMLGIVTGVVSSLMRGTFLSNVDFGALVGLPLPTGFHISSSFLFEVSICLSVLGSVALMLNTLGHPGQDDDPHIAAEANQEE